MKKHGVYLLSALLLGGVSSTLVGCIDTTEPAGITELRGAKAALLKAKAAFIDAKTQREAVYLEQNKVTLETQKLDLEIKKLNVELQKTLNALKNDSANMAHKLYLETIQKKRDSLALRAEEDWWKVQKDIATAEETYKKAIVDLQVTLLTYKDEAIAEQIKEYTTTLYGANWNSNSGTTVLTGGLYGLLNQANLDLVKAQREKVLFTAKTEDYLNTLNLTKTKEENILKIQQDLLTRMKELSENFAQDSLQAVKERIIEIDDAIAQLDQKKIDLYNEIKTMRNTTLAGVSEKLAEYDAILNKDTTIVIEVVDAKLQDELGNYLSGNYPNSFTRNSEGKYEMIAPIEISDELRDISTSSDFSSILNTIKNSIYQDDYVQAYYTYTGKSVSANELFETDGKTVKAAYLTQIQNEIKRLALDQENVRTDYETAMNAWLDAYKAFTDDLNDYEGYQAASAIYNDTKKAIQDYQTAISELDLADPDYNANYLALAKGLRQKLVAYFDVRVPIDGAGSNYATFEENYIGFENDGTTDKLTSTNMTSFTSALADITGLLGVENIKTKSYSSSDLSNTNTKGTLPDFLRAAEDLFGHNFYTNGNMSLKATLQPVEGENGAYTTPDGLDAKTYVYEMSYGSITSQYYNVIQSGSKFMNAALTYNQPAILTTLPDWVSLYEKIDGQMDQAADRVDGLIAAKKALVEENQDAYTAIWEKEIECYLIDALITIDTDGDGTAEVTNLFDTNNPYYANYIASGQNKDDDNLMDFTKPDATLTEKGVLQAEKDVLTSFSTTGQVTYVKYNETTGTYSITSGTWENLIGAQEKVVEAAQEDVDNVQQRIDLLNELGYMESTTSGTPDYTGDLNISTTVGQNDQYIELLDKEIEQAQKKVETLQAEFDRIQGKIQDLIQAVENADFGSSDATYPGFNVDNDAIDVPDTEVPDTEEPDTEEPDTENPATEEPDAEQPAE